MKNDTSKVKSPAQKELGNTFWHLKKKGKMKRKGSIPTRKSIWQNTARGLIVSGRNFILVHEYFVKLYTYRTLHTLSFYLFNFSIFFQYFSFIIHNSTQLCLVYILFQHHVIMANYAYGVPLNHTFLPEKLKALGYDTHIIGKWVISK